MATIDATVGGAAANSYVLVLEADTYFDERLNAEAWTSQLDEQVKIRALITAARRLDAEEYEGTKTTEGQALKWPRIGAFDDDGNEFSSDIIPDIVKHAQMELALRMLRDADQSQDTLADTGLEGFNRVRVGPIEVEPRHAQKGAALPEIVRALLRPVLVTSPTVGRTMLA